MPDNPQKTESAIDRFLSRGKDLVALLRDGSILLLAVLLLAFPSVLNDILVSAGFEEGSIVGFKWKAGLIQSDEALKTAQSTITNLQGQLQKANEALAHAQASLEDRTLKEQLQALEQQNRAVAKASATAQLAVNSSIESNAPLIDRAQRIDSQTGKWAVVFGSDTSLAAAQTEINRAARLGIEGAGIYYRNGYYASIAVVDDRALANKYLEITKTFRPDAYIASFSSWCKSSRQQEGYVECTSTR